MGILAFGMVELLVTISLIAILAVLLVPAWKRVLSASQAAQCINNLRQIYTASMSYAQDNNMEVPCAYLNPNTGIAWHMALAGEGGGGVPGRVNVYLPLEYGVRPNVLSCPTNPAVGQWAGRPGLGSWGWTNYAVNGYLYDGLWKPKRLTALERPVVFYLDSFDGGELTTFEVIKGNANPWSGVHAVHDRRINMIFTDGHVKSPAISPRIIDPGSGNLGEMEFSWFRTD